MSLHHASSDDSSAQKSRATYAAVLTCCALLVACSTSGTSSSGADLAQEHSDTSQAADATEASDADTALDTANTDATAGDATAGDTTAGDTTAGDATDADETDASIRGNRYCELLIATVTDATVDAQVWGTQGLNACPADDWATIVPADIATEFGAMAVKVNGPRYWLIDRVTAELPDGEPRLFGTLEMRKLATISLAITELSETPYTERTVNRNSEFEFNAGAEVYELVATDGATYVMQSYAQIVDPALSEAALSALGSRLSLPNGWTFQARTLDAPLIISTPGKATVLQDDLQNTYSRVPTAL